MALPASRDFGAEMEGMVPEEVEPTRSESSVPKPKIKVTFQDAFKKGDSKEQSPENFLMESMAMRPRSMSHHLQSTEVPSRRWLTIRANFWRSCMTLGMKFHDYAPPKPPKPSFKRHISTTTIPIDLCFYVSKEYERMKKSNPNHRSPIVVNFHGGGFCLGSPTDDRYWAAVILKDTPAVFVSVGYRRAPEHPFPQPVDDCVEALLYLQTHAEELRLDPSQIALSGFSAGANLAFTVPFRLTYQYAPQSSSEHIPIPRRTTVENFVPEPESPTEAGTSPSARHEQELGLLKPLPDANTSQALKQPSPWSSTSDLQNTSTNHSIQTGQTSRTNLLNLPGPRSYLLRGLTQQSVLSKHNNHSSQSLDSLDQSNSDRTPRIRIVSILAWYPLLDWTSSRAEKKRGSRNPKRTLAKVFTDLFDFSYLPAPDHAGHHCSPYASPALAPDHMIVDGLPNRIQMWLCEWDMLLAEGEMFASRLAELGKDVKTEMIEGVPHGWDKSPNPWRDQKRINALYERAAGYLNSVFGEADRQQTVGEGIGFGGIR